MVICDVKKFINIQMLIDLVFVKYLQEKNVFRSMRCKKNLYVGMKTVFAPNGSFIPGKNFKLEKKSYKRNRR